jgi:hypothetical protein
MPIAFINGIGATNAASGTTLTTGSYTVTAGSLLVAVWRHNHDNVNGSGTPIINISDSRGNTWTSADSATQGIANVQDGWRVGIAYAMNAIAASTTFTFTISDSRAARGIAVLEYSGAAALSATGKFQPTALDTGARTPIVSSTYSTSGPTLTVVVASTISGANLADWTGITVAGNATTGRSPANYDTSAYIRDYISTGAFSSVTSSASNNNGSIGKTIVSASFAEATPILYTAIDEIVSDRNDYIQSSTAGQVYQTTLQSVAQPGADTNIDFNFDANSPDNSGSIKFDLLSGATLVKSHTVTLSASSSQASVSITPSDYSVIDTPRFGRFLPQRWRQQPQSAVQIDWSNPLTKSLAVWADSRSLWLSATPKSQNRSGLSGAATGLIQSTGSYQRTFVPSVLPVAISGTEWSTFGEVIVSSTGGFQALWAFENASYSSSIAVMSGAYPSGNFGLDIRPYATDTNSTRLFSTNIPVVCGATVSVSGNSVKGYYNGKLEFSPSLISTASASFDRLSVFMKRGNLDGSPAGTKINWMALWARALSESESSALNENPWQIFRPNPGRIYGLPSAGGWPWTPTLRVTSQ